MKSSLFPHMLCVLLTCLFCLHSLHTEAKILYVNVAATGTGDGSSWSNAYTQLQAAIDVAEENDTLCVAAGLYLPTHLLGFDPIRSTTFYIAKSILLYGGFAGIPGSEGNFSERNPVTHETILSGDTGVPGDKTDNAFHVVYIDHVSDTMRLDGFTVADGGWFNTGGLDGTGVGIFNNAEAGRSHPVIANCIIRDHVATESGGGMLNYAASGGHAHPLLTNCTFMWNTSSGGGGISNYSDTEGSANPTLINCRFMANTARTADGGAFNSISHSSTGEPTFINCIITGNHSPNSAAYSAFSTGTGVSAPYFINCAFSGNTGGAIRVSDIGSQNSHITIRNSIVFGNAGGAGITTSGLSVDAAFSIIPFGFPGENIIGLDPLWISQPPLDSANTEGDLHLQDNSPAIDAGRNDDFPPGIATDLDNKPRFINPFTQTTGTIDIGPYEVQSITTTGIRSFLSDTDWKVFPTITNDAVTIMLSENVIEGQLSLLDLKGNKISTQDLNNGQRQYHLQVSTLNPGAYLVHIQMNGMQDVKKILVQ